jgi:2-(1,2-epoxy-1,2-dihydrophenyl)acetyl-CoA isomerase
MKTFKNLLIEHKGPALWISLNRPDKKNALHIESAREFLAALRRGLAVKDALVVVLSGTGDAFSAGGDIRLMSEILRGKKTCKPFFLEISRIMNAAVTEIRRSEKPVIAAVPGFAGGVAFGLVLAADLRIASEKASFSAATIRIGLVANGSATYHLPRIVGLATASEILFLGDSLSARDALKIGLVNRVVPDAQLSSAVQEIALKLADSPRKALGRLKKLLNASAGASLPAQLEAERRAIAWSSTLPDFREGVSAFLEKRKGVFNR